MGHQEEVPMTFDMFWRSVLKPPSSSSPMLDWMNSQQCLSTAGKVWEIWNPSQLDQLCKKLQKLCYNFDFWLKLIGKQWPFCSFRKKLVSLWSSQYLISYVPVPGNPVISVVLISFSFRIKKIVYHAVMWKQYTCV